MEKIIQDRLNYLRSELANATRVKLTKVHDQEKIHELKIRINELILIKYKHEATSKKK